MARVIHFEFLADDPQRATSFWSEAFGWQVHTAPGQTYWPVTTGEDGTGINGAIMARADFSRAAGGSAPSGAICTVQVDALEDAVAAVERAGGRVVVPLRTVPGVGRVAYCVDPEGTVFGVFEPEHAP